MRHEKNDRHSVNDRNQWVLGFDNKEKWALFKQQAAEIGGRISELEETVRKIGSEEDAQQAKMLHCQNLSNLTWNDVDVGSLLTRIDDASIRLKAEREARPDLAALNDSIRQQEEVHSKAVDKKNAEDGKGQSISIDINRLKGTLAEIGRASCRERVCQYV